MSSAGDAAKLDEILRRHDDVERPRCVVEARAGRPVERSERGRAGRSLRTGRALRSCGASCTNRACLPSRTRRTGRADRARRADGAGSARVTLRPLETRRPGSTSRACRALRARRATLVPRDDPLVPPAVGCVTHHPEEPLARLLAADDHAVGPRTRSRERRRARHGKRGDAGDDDCSSVHVSLPSSMSPTVVSTPDARSQMPKRDMCPRFGMVERRCGRPGTDS